MIRLFLFSTVLCLLGYDAAIAQPSKIYGQGAANQNMLKYLDRLHKEDLARKKKEKAQKELAKLELKRTEQISRIPIPDSVTARVQASAAKRHPNNYSAQKYVIDKQLQAWRNLKALRRPSDMPATVYRGIVKDAAERHATDYLTLEYLINREIKAYYELTKNN